MSKFINTEKKMVLDSLVDGLKNRLNNPYYGFLDKKPTLSTYYNQSTSRSTLDVGSKITYSMTGSTSSIKLNKINNFYLYGLDRIMVNLTNGDFGVESDPIEGEAVILPNTIIPIANDFFSIDYLNKKLLFKVTSVTQDTVENGGNFYKIEYKLDQLSDEVIQCQVVEEFEMIVNNLGTQFNTIIKSDKYKYVLNLEDILLRLKKYYKNLFYSSRVQTFIFSMDNTNFYDPYIVEFLIRNKILNDDEEYLFITHQLFNPSTFFLDYDKTFFRCVELGEYDERNKISSVASLIDNPMSILSSRKEEYYRLEYCEKLKNIYAEPIFNFNPDIVTNILNNTVPEEITYENIIIKYFLKMDITTEDILSIEKIDYNTNINLFYNIPIIIYILENNIKKELVK